MFFKYIVNNLLYIFFEKNRTAKAVGSFVITLIDSLQKTLNSNLFFIMINI